MEEKNDSNSPYIVIYNKIDLLHKEVQKREDTLKVSAIYNSNQIKKIERRLEKKYKNK